MTLSPFLPHRCNKLAQMKNTKVIAWLMHIKFTKVRSITTCYRIIHMINMYTLLKNMIKYIYILPGLILSYTWQIHQPAKITTADPLSVPFMCNELLWNFPSYSSYKSWTKPIDQLTEFRWSKPHWEILN